jgi:hypothetical protein
LDMSYNLELLRFAVQCSLQYRKAQDHSSCPTEPDVPICKSNSKTNFSNYQGNSLLSTIYMIAFEIIPSMP